MKCLICGADNPKFALPLTRENGKWIVKPVCYRCKGALMSEAYAQGKSIGIYSLSGSLREAERRNANAHLYTPFLDAFAKMVDVNNHRYDGDRRKPIKAKAKEASNP